MTEARKIFCILIDDDRQAIKQFEDAISESSQFVLTASFQNAVDFKLAAIDCHPDILFLDVEMPEKDGLSLAKEIQDLNIHSKIVFVQGQQIFDVKSGLYQFR